MVEPGDTILWQQPAPTNDDSGTQAPGPSPADPLYFQAIIADFRRRISDLENQIVLQVPSDGILSAITLSQEAVLIQADKIGIFGDAIFADWLRDVNGVSLGVVDPSITLIRGGVIRTGEIVNQGGNCYMNLDATGSTNFIQCDNSGVGVYIQANGHFTFGNSAGHKITWNGSSIGINGDINTVGTGIFGGSSSAAGSFFAVVANSGGAANCGVVGFTSTSLGTGVAGQASATNAIGISGIATGSGGVGCSASSSNSGYGVFGFASDTGSVGVLAENANSGHTALAVIGNMTINNTNLVTNLNAQYCNGVTFPGAGSGTATGTPVYTGKPGTNQNSLWAAISVGGVTYDWQVYPR